jgi:hypothetical protein
VVLKGAAAFFIGYTISLEVEIMEDGWLLLPEVHKTLHLTLEQMYGLI